MTFGASIPLIKKIYNKILILIKNFTLPEISQLTYLININLVIIKSLKNLLMVGY